MKGNYSYFYSYMHGVYILSFRISTLGSISTLWVWSLQVINTLTACEVVPSSSHPSCLTRYPFISSKIRSISRRRSDTLWNSARNTTRSASDLPFTAVPFPRDPHCKRYNTFFQTVLTF